MSDMSPQTANSLDKCKLARPLEDGSLVPYDWGNQFTVEEAAGDKRLLATTSTDRIAFLIEMLRPYPGPLIVCYVLIEDKPGLPMRPGYYYSPEVNLDQVIDFLTEFQDMFVYDGSQAVHLLCKSSGGLVVYDEHDLYFLYGDFSSQLELLRSRGYADGGDFCLDRHAHFFRDSFSLWIFELFKLWPWGYRPFNGPTDANG